jgi:enoyl-[acyl-carrier-protein] reductase (NADH)
VPGEPANSDVSAAPHRQAIAKTIASTALYLAGDESRMVTDQVMLVDGEVTIT